MVIRGSLVSPYSLILSNRRETIASGETRPWELGRDEPSAFTKLTQVEGVSSGAVIAQVIREDRESWRQWSMEWGGDTVAKGRLFSILYDWSTSDWSKLESHD